MDVAAFSHHRVEPLPVDYMFEANRRGERVLGPGVAINAFVRLPVGLKPIRRPFMTNKRSNAADIAWSLCRGPRDSVRAGDHPEATERPKLVPIKDAVAQEGN